MAGMTTRGWSGIFYAGMVAAICGAALIAIWIFVYSMTINFPNADEEYQKQRRQAMFWISAIAMCAVGFGGILVLVGATGKLHHERGDDIRALLRMRRGRDYAPDFA